MCVFISSTSFVWKISYSNKKWTRICYNFTLVLMYSTSCSSRILIKLEFYRQIFRKIAKYPNSRQSVHWKPRRSMRTDWHDAAHSLLPKNSTSNWKVESAKNINIKTSTEKKKDQNAIQLEYCRVRKNFLYIYNKILNMTFHCETRSEIIIIIISSSSSSSSRAGPSGRTV
jgi:hypothetical protein